MEQPRRPGTLSVALAAFAALFVLNAIAYGSHMAPVWYYRARPQEATELVLRCRRERLSETRCYQASEALNPLPPPALARWFGAR